MAPPVQALAAKLDGTPVQVALAWLLVRVRMPGHSVVPIPGTRKAPRIAENPGALRLDFTAAHLEKLDAAAHAVVGSAGSRWVSEGREQPGRQQEMRE